MKKHILTILLIFFLPVALLAHGETPFMYSMLVLVFFFPLFFGFFEYSQIKKKLKIQEINKKRLILFNWLISIISIIIGIESIKLFELINQNLIYFFNLLGISVIQIIPKIIVTTQPK